MGLDKEMRNWRKLLLMGAMVAAWGSAQALSSILEVKPGKTPDAKVETDGFVFTVQAGVPEKGAVPFHIVITEGTAKFTQDNPEIKLERLKNTAAGVEGAFFGIDMTSLSAAEMPVLKIKREGDTATCDFQLPEKLLADPEVCLTFANYAVLTKPDGTKINMPAEDLYYVLLKAFAALTTGAQK
jgi:hypothetical protein